MQIGAPIQSRTVPAEALFDELKASQWILGRGWGKREWACLSLTVSCLSGVSAAVDQSWMQSHTFVSDSSVGGIPDERGAPKTDRTALTARGYIEQYCVTNARCLARVLKVITKQIKTFNMVFFLLFMSNKPLKIQPQIEMNHFRLTDRIPCCSLVTFKGAVGLNVCLFYWCTNSKIHHVIVNMYYHRWVE